MAKTFQVEVVTPDATAVSARATALRAPAWEGYLGVLAGHAPLLCVLKPGVLTFRDPDGATKYYAVKGGFMEVTPERVVVLADAIEPAEEVDVAAAEKELEAAEEPLVVPAAAAAAGALLGAGAAARAKARDEAAEAKEEARLWAKARLDASDRAKG
jgi:F-type H+-transporting ATPase subunit epsilon